MSFLRRNSLPTSSFDLAQRLNASRSIDEPYPFENPRKKNHDPPGPSPLAQTFTAVDQPAIVARSSRFTISSSVPAHGAKTCPQANTATPRGGVSKSYDSPSDQQSLDRDKFAAELCSRLEAAQQKNEEPKYYGRLNRPPKKEWDMTPDSQSPPFEMGIAPIPREEWNDEALLLIGGPGNYLHRTPTGPAATLSATEASGIEAYVPASPETRELDAGTTDAEYAPSSSIRTGSETSRMISDAEIMAKKAEVQPVEMKSWLGETEAQSSGMHSGKILRRRNEDEEKAKHEEPRQRWCEARSTDVLSSHEMLRDTQDLQSLADSTEVTIADSTMAEAFDHKVRDSNRLNMSATAGDVTQAIRMALNVTDNDATSRLSRSVESRSEQKIDGMTGIAEGDKTQPVGRGTLPLAQQAATAPRPINRAIPKQPNRPPIPSIGEAVPEGEFPIPRIRRSCPEQQSTSVLGSAPGENETPARKKSSQWDQFCCFPKTPLGDMAPWTRLGWSQHVCLICHTAYRPKDNLVVLPCEHMFHKDCVLPRSSELLQIDPPSMPPGSQELHSHPFQQDSHHHQRYTDSNRLIPPSVTSSRARQRQDSLLVDRPVGTPCCLCHTPGRGIRAKPANWKDLWEETIRNTQPGSRHGPKSKIEILVESLRRYRDRRGRRTIDQDGGNMIRIVEQSKDNLISQQTATSGETTKKRRLQKHIANLLTIDDYGPGQDLIDWIDRYYELVDGQFCWRGKDRPIQGHVWNGITE